MKKYYPSIVMWLIFEAVAVTLWLTLNNSFYFFNFTYIGSFIAAGLALYEVRFKYARLVVQFGVGLYMLVYLGIICRENMQLEGFWYYLFLGVFEAATIHYVVAKLVGPVVFGRGWCGYACWTAMVLDLLPWKAPKNERKKLGWFRYVTFAASFLYVSALFLMKIENLERVMWVSFIVGNILYYILGVALAFYFKDNRAFCKYICPVTVFLKLGSRFSLLRVRAEKEKCVECGACRKACPMNVDMTDPSRNRINGTECILCSKCVDVCPKNVLDINFGFK